MGTLTKIDEMPCPEGAHRVVESLDFVEPTWPQGKGNHRTKNSGGLPSDWLVLGLAS